MTSESTGTTENEALGKKIGAIEKEVATVKVAIRRGSRTRLCLLVVALALVGTAIWMFYGLAKDFGSKENLNLLAETARTRMEDSSALALEHVRKLADNAVPVLKEALIAHSSELL